MIEVLPQSEGNLLVVKATKKLTDQDYKDVLIPRLEAVIREHGKVRFLMDLSDDFHGWEAHAVWDDAQFGLAHRSDFTKMAVIGGPRWVEWGLKIGGWLMEGEIRSFPTEKRDDAFAWIHEGSPVKTS